MVMNQSEFCMEHMAQQAKLASLQVAQLSTTQKNQLLTDMAAAIRQAKSAIMAENEKDLIAGKAKGLSEAMLDRLTLTAERIDGIADAIMEIVHLPDSRWWYRQYAAKTKWHPSGKNAYSTGCCFYDL